MTGGAQGTIIQRIDRMQATAVMLWITFGGAIFYFGWHLATFNRRGGPGPGFFLKGLAALLLFLAMVRLVTLVRGAFNGGGASAADDIDPAQERFEAANVAKFAALVAALTLYAYLLPKIGFLLATAALCWATLMLAGRHPLRSLAEAAMASFFVFFCFTHGLGVPLPAAQPMLLRSLGF